MALYPGKEVRLINKSTKEEHIYEVAQVIYSYSILGIACITENGIVDFYFSEYVIKPFNFDKGRDKF